MPPKKPSGAPSKKSEQKKKEKVIEVMLYLNVITLINYKVIF